MPRVHLLVAEPTTFLTVDPCPRYVRRPEVREAVGSDGVAAILLATFNGEPFLRQLLDSVEVQSFRGWEVWARDDGSDDATQLQLARFAERHQGRVQLVRDDERLGPCRSFDRLLTLAARGSAAQHFFFCDQDDVWHADKVERMLAGIRRIEARHGAGTPVLLHSDLRVVGPRLEVIHPSFKAHQRTDASRWTGFRQLLVQNVVTGCATVVNRALVERMGGVPEQAVMHDWWSALVAAAFGRVVYDARATVDYRQHGSNAIGAQDVRLLELLRKGLGGMAIKQMLVGRLRQAEAFAEIYGAELDAAETEALRAFIEAMRSPPLLRGVRLAKRGFTMTSGTRTAGLFVPVVLPK